jgi:hypothetical protein
MRQLGDLRVYVAPMRTHLRRPAWPPGAWKALKESNQRHQGSVRSLSDHLSQDGDVFPGLTSASRI